MFDVSKKQLELKSANYREVAIVVTYNRKRLLVSTIKSLLNQSRACDIIIVDNASTDGTKNALSSQGIFNLEQINYIRMKTNVGGAGGFSQGLKIAKEAGWDWFWLMDDDAIPEYDALENLIKYALQPETAYGSIAINRNEGITKLCWPTIKIKDNKKRFTEFPDMLAGIEEVTMIPFIGFFVNRCLVERVGYPDPGFFICADDHEYSERIRSHGKTLALIKSSKIHHPLPDITLYDFGLFQSAYRSLPPWKIYYDVRNKILIANKYFKQRLLTQTLPGIFLRLAISVVKRDNPGKSMIMTLKAVIDGLSNRKGANIKPPF